MADGQGCVCMAYSSSECACNADWTPQEVIDLRAENKRLREALSVAPEKPCVCGHTDCQFCPHKTAPDNCHLRTMTVWGE